MGTSIPRVPQRLQVPAVYVYITRVPIELVVKLEEGFVDAHRPHQRLGQRAEHDSRVFRGVCRHPVATTGLPEAFECENERVFRVIQVDRHGLIVTQTTDMVS